MTPQEAIDFIDNEVNIDVRYCSDEKVNKTIEVFDLAKSALEKQIPKKPEHDNGAWFICPACCGSVLGNSEESLNGEISYCEHCGRALDWSDTE